MAKLTLVIVLTAPTPHGGSRLVVGKNNVITGFHIRDLLSALTADQRSHPDHNLFQNF